MQALLARQRGLLLQRLGGVQHQQQHPHPFSSADGRRGTRRQSPVTAASATQQQQQQPTIPPPRHGELITSPSNRYVRHCVKLRDSPRHRWEHGSALLVGATLLGELAAASGGGGGGGNGTLPNARVLFVPADDEDDDDDDITTTHNQKLAALAPSSDNTPRSRCAVVRASKPVLRALAGVPTAGEGAEGEDRLAAAVVDIPRDLVAYLSKAGSLEAAVDQATRVLLRSSSAPSPSTPSTAATTKTPLRLLALEGVQDPGNLGTLLRTAAAFGWQGAWLLPGCADPFGAKAVRAARGAQLRSPLVTGPGAGWDALAAFAAENNAKLVAAALPGQVKRKEKDDDGGDDGGDNGTNANANAIVLVLGSEGQGLSAEALRRCDASLSVPMVEGAMESLNVAVAGGVLMFALGSGGGGAAGGKRSASAPKKSAASPSSSSPAVKTLLRDINALF
jgi:TrmH family RNA methyltransferase